VTLLDSIIAAGGRRVMIVNGHGGNSGVCHAAAGEAVADSDLAVAVLDYWRLVEDRPTAPGAVPGHAGWFETSLVHALRPELIIDPERRAEPQPVQQPAQVEFHCAAAWSAVDGYTDRPDLADQATGEELLEEIVSKLSERIVQTAGIEIPADAGGQS
jgi:creatinine amidohydrolase